MKPTEPPNEDATPASGMHPTTETQQMRAKTRPVASRRIFWGIAYCVALLLMFWGPIVALVRLASKSELQSHILLIPFISGYLIYIRRSTMPSERTPGIAAGLIAWIFGILAWLAGRGAPPPRAHFSGTDALSWTILSLVCLMIAGGFLFLGKKWMRSAAFPAAFLLFLIPMPEALVFELENASKLASSEATDFFFTITGTPFLRSGNVFELPGIVIEVAQECSGIRSSLVLFITSLLASQLFLRSPWRRALLVAFVIPLGVVRNGFRILVLGLLCVHVGPQMINSEIHHRGGPLFFALSLIPMFLLLWWLRKGDRESSKGAVNGPLDGIPAAANEDRNSGIE